MFSRANASHEKKFRHHAAGLRGALIFTTADTANTIPATTQLVCVGR